jgi:hypothetical protein
MTGTYCRLTLCDTVICRRLPPGLPFRRRDLRTAKWIRLRRSDAGNSNATDRGRTKSTRSLIRTPQLVTTRLKVRSVKNMLFLSNQQENSQFRGVNVAYASGFFTTFLKDYLSKRIIKDFFFFYFVLFLMLMIVNG